MDLEYPFADICLYDPDKVMQEMTDFMDTKQNNNIYYVAYYQNEDNPRNPDILREQYLPKMKRLIDLIT